MKLNHKAMTLLSMGFLLFCCSKQPVGNTLLSSVKSGTLIDNTPIIDQSALEIQPDNPTVTVSIDDSDRVEITGTCKDLDRKKNRILVEVFAGEDETVDPYISNGLSDLCQNVFANAGLLVTDKCFWVTKGIGITEDAGLLTERSFPQCHDGRFGFTVKLGKILVPLAGANFKYTVRFKLRTLDGILTDTAFSRVFVARELNVPMIDSSTYSVTPLTIQCNVKTSPARFNFGILYSLTRVATDAAGTISPPLTLYQSGIFPIPTTFNIIDGQSEFSWNDTPNGGTNLMLQGVTYNYTLTSAENNFVYLPLVPIPTAVSNTVPCKNSLGESITSTLKLSAAVPAPFAGTCFTGLLTRANPNWSFPVVGPVTYQWGYNTTSNWVGADSNAQSGFITAAGCNNNPSCSQGGLISGVTYFFAVREITTIGPLLVSKWSDVFQCKPP